MEKLGLQRMTKWITRLETFLTENVCPLSARNRICCEYPWPQPDCDLCSLPGGQLRSNTGIFAQCNIILAHLQHSKFNIVYTA